VEKVTVETVLRVVCECAECGAELSASVDVSDDKITVTAPPCKKCSKEEYDAGYEQGVADSEDDD
jgi:hypothetical protein